MPRSRPVRASAVLLAAGLLAQVAIAGESPRPARQIEGTTDAGRAFRGTVAVEGGRAVARVRLDGVGERVLSCRVDDTDADAARAFAIRERDAQDGFRHKLLDLHAQDGAAFELVPRAAAPERPARFEAPEGDFTRLVLCLDGVPYRVMRDLQARGYFADFRPASRLVTVFPSVSSPAWATILDIGPEPGYQSVYFSNRANATNGVSADEMTGVRFETRMHLRSEGVIEHAAMYVAPNWIARRALRHTAAEIAELEGTGRTAFVYMVETDVLCHMRGHDAIVETLIEVDRLLEELQAEHEARTGKRLEIALLSDHGHTLREGQVVAIGEILEQAGFRKNDTLEGPRDVAYTQAGILGVISLHTREENEQELARVAVGAEGVELTCWDEAGRTRVCSPYGEAAFDHDAARDAYRYEVTAGDDPLGYLPVWAALAREGKVDADGFARSRDILAATAGHRFPDAPHRMRRGLNDLVISSGNVLVSLEDGWENANGFVKLAARFIGRSGTHGSLADSASDAILLTNYMDTPSVLRAEDVRSVIDLGDYHRNARGLELTLDPGGPRAAELVVRDDGIAAHAATGGATAYAVRVYRDRWIWRDPLVFSRRVAADALPRRGNLVELRLPELLARLADDTDYRIEIAIERRDATGAVLAAEEREIEVTGGRAFQSVRSGR